MTGERSLLLDLPPELRTAVYIEYFQMSHVVFIHPDASKPVACGGLARVKRQIRQELGTLPYEHASVLSVGVVDYEFGQLLELRKDLPKIAPAIVVPATPAPSALTTNERVDSLRSRRSDAPPPEPAYRLLAVMQLVILLRQKEEIRVNLLKPRIRAWCDSFAGDGHVI